LPGTAVIIGARLGWTSQTAGPELCSLQQHQVLFAPKAAEVVADTVWHHTQTAARRSFEGQVGRLAVPISNEDLAVTDAEVEGARTPASGGGHTLSTGRNGRPTHVRKFHTD